MTEQEFNKELFMEYRKALVWEFGTPTIIEGKEVHHLPCITWQKLMNHFGVLEKTNAPRYFNAMIGCWFSPPSILEEELKDLGFKWAWNQNGECEHCPSYMVFCHEDAMAAIQASESKGDYNR